MAKQLIFQTDKEYPFSITKLDRKKLYGWKDQVAFDSSKQECVKADIDASGSFIIPKGGRAFGTLDNDGNWVDKKGLSAVYKDGKPAVLIPSSFDKPVELEKTVPVEEFLDYNIESVYILEPGEGGEEMVELVKNSDEVYTFPFNYHPGYEASPAFIIENKGNLFVLIGYLAQFEYIGLEEIAEITAEEDEEEIFEDDLDFSMM
ncbi:MAG: hypothetical protein GY749_32660 [Desulfobacteraceae bacterium]|nr:hypothetical protein [Desulfobacteraceae bacterium]